MTKGCLNAYNSDKAAEKSAKTYRRQTGKQTSVSSQKKCLSKIRVRKQDFKNRHYTFALRHKKSYAPAARLEETQGMSTPNGVRLA